MYTVTLTYQIASYSGEITITSDIDEQEHWIAVARKILTRRAGSLPMGCESWRVITVEAA